MVVVPPIGTPLSSLPPQVVDSGRSSNGKTADSGSAYRGSNPCLPAKRSPSPSFAIIWLSPYRLGVGLPRVQPTPRRLPEPLWETKTDTYSGAARGWQFHLRSVFHANRQTHP